MKQKKKKNRRILTSNIYAFLAMKILLTFTVLIFTQLFFHLSNIRIFHIDGFSEWVGIAWGNIIFGMATIGFALLPYLAANLLPFSFRWNKTFRSLTELFLYILPSLFLVVANVSDAAYYQFTYRRLSGDIFRYLGIGGQMGALVPHFLVDYWPATLFGLAVIVFFLWASMRIRLLPRDRYRRHVINDIVGFVLGGLVIVFLFRGGFGQNIHWHDTTKYCQAKNNALVTNSGYNILRTFTGGTLHEVAFMPDEEAQEFFNPVFTTPQDYGESDWAEAWEGWTIRAGQYGRWPSIDSVDWRYNNVVIIVLESFSQEYMGCYNQGVMPSFTPFLDSLAEHCVVYNGRANGKKSIEGIPAILTSIPTLMPFPLTLSDYANDTIDALPAILRRNGFHTAFFHGCYNGVMGFDQFCQKCGFDDYYGQDEYLAAAQSTPGENVSRDTRSADYDGCWGIFDEPFLQYMVRQMGTFREPFFSTVFTISSHHPYTMPEKYKGHFPEGEHPLLSVVSYTDNALREFFNAARKTDWYQNTLFVITADHPGQGLHREYNDYDGWYRIPMMFYSPLREEVLAPELGPLYGMHKRENRIMQQADIMPTLLDYLGINGVNTVCFGTSVFRNPDDGWQIAYGNGYYQLETNHGVAVISQYEVENTQLSTRSRRQPVEPTAKNNKQKAKSQLLQAIIQQYNHRLINNQLVP